MIKVVHVIIGLDIGGAEMMLKRLIETHKDNPTYRHVVISLTSIGHAGQQLQTLGVEVYELGMRSVSGIPRVLFQLVRKLREIRPNIIQTWMYHADLLGGLAARITGNRNVIWGVRCTAIPQGRFSATQMVVNLCSWLSGWVPRVIVCCAESARSFHARLGYDRSKLLVINNGYDLSQFNKDQLKRQKARAAFGFGDDDIVIGIVGRFDPLKDYRNFINAAAVVVATEVHVKFLMVGRDIDPANSKLYGWLAETGKTHRFVLAGERHDIPMCLASMDIFCLSSVKEGFPNVVCEAMASGVPCVVTDAGDAARIVSDTGLIVPTSDSAALAKALQKMTNMSFEERARLGELARYRIEKHFSISNVCAQYESLYSQVTTD